jgi:hypothetical protein
MIIWYQRLSAPILHKHDSYKSLFVRILKTEDLLTSHIDSTSLNQRHLSAVMISWLWDFVLSLLNGIPLSVLYSSNSFWKTFMPLIHPWSWHCMIFPRSLHQFFVSVGVFNSWTQIACVIIAHCSMSIADVISSEVCKTFSYSIFFQDNLIVT